LSKKKRNRSIRLPFCIYWSCIVVLTIIGFLVSLYLLKSHYRIYSDIGYKSFCAITRSINCDTVSQSPYSILFGIPIPLWGIFGYVILLLFLVLSMDKQGVPQRFWSLIFLMALIYSLMSVFFAYLSTFHIRSYCIMCIATYAVNLLVLFYAWIIRRRFDSDFFFTALQKDIGFLFKKRKKAIFLFSPLLTGAVLTLIFLPSYWKIPPPPLVDKTPTGYTQEGHPWIGASHPILTIIEFSDYQCFQCKKMHFYLRRLINENPTKIRLVHRHFPMDHKFNPLLKEPFHIGSGEMALLAIYAATKDTFWETNDLLFDMGGQKRAFNTREIGEKTGLNYIHLARARKDPRLILRLQRDILEGIKLGIQGTPSFLIDNQLYIGQIPSEIILKALK